MLPQLLNFLDVDASDPKSPDWRVRFWGSLRRCFCAPPPRRPKPRPAPLTRMSPLGALFSRIRRGTIAVYTCSASCCPRPGDGTYAEEFVWVQA